MSTIIDQNKHKENLAELGRFAAVAFGFLILCLASFYVNFTYTPQVPWFVAVIIIGSVKVVPWARRVLRKFEENTKQF